MHTTPPPAAATPDAAAPAAVARPARRRQPSRSTCFQRPVRLLCAALCGFLLLAPPQARGNFLEFVSAVIADWVDEPIADFIYKRNWFQSSDYVAGQALLARAEAARDQAIALYNLNTARAHCGYNQSLKADYNEKISRFIQEINQFVRILDRANGIDKYTESIEILQGAAFTSWDVAVLVAGPAKGAAGVILKSSDAVAAVWHLNNVINEITDILGNPPPDFDAQTFALLENLKDAFAGYLQNLDLFDVMTSAAQPPATLFSVLDACQNSISECRRLMDMLRQTAAAISGLQGLAGEANLGVLSFGLFMSAAELYYDLGDAVDAWTGYLSASKTLKASLPIFEADVNAFENHDFNAWHTHAEGQCPDDTTALRFLTVENGAGSGNYAPGALVTITANPPPAGKVFDRWELAADAGLSLAAGASNPVTSLVMPAAALTLTATYKTDPAADPAVTPATGAWTLKARVLTMTRTADADADGYAERYTFGIGVDADCAGGSGVIFARLTCATTGQTWRTPETWTVSGINASYEHGFTFSQADFPSVSGDTLLVFTAAIHDAGTGVKLAEAPLVERGELLLVDSITAPDAPLTVTTQPAASITKNSATIAAAVTGAGGAGVIIRGVVWSTSPSPTLATGQIACELAGAGQFTATLAGLTQGTTYHARAYAYDGHFTYGNEVSFTTEAIANPDRVVSFTTNGGTIYYLTADGKLYGMGYNDYGQLGDGTTSHLAPFIVGLPVFTRPPNHQIAAAHSDATFNVQVSAIGQLTYQWQRSTDNGLTWANISGATTAALTLSAVSTSQNNNRYRCIATNSLGTATSNAATVTPRANASNFSLNSAYNLLKNN